MQKNIVLTLVAALIVASTVACGGEVEEESTGTSEQELRISLGAKGDNCSIDLPNGTKEPGTDNGDGKCCSVFDSTKCVDLPKKDKVFSVGGYAVGGGAGTYSRQ